MDSVTDASQRLFKALDRALVDSPRQLAATLANRCIVQAPCAGGKRALAEANAFLLKECIRQFASPPSLWTCTAAFDLLDTEHDRHLSGVAKGKCKQLSWAKGQGAVLRYVWVWFQRAMRCSLSSYSAEVRELKALRISLRSAQGRRTPGGSPPQPLQSLQTLPEYPVMDWGAMDDIVCISDEDNVTHSNIPRPTPPPSHAATIQQVRRRMRPLPAPAPATVPGALQSVPTAKARARAAVTRRPRAADGLAAATSPAPAPLPAPAPAASHEAPPARPLATERPAVAANPAAMQLVSAEGRQTEAAGHAVANSTAPARLPATSMEPPAAAAASSSHAVAIAKAPAETRLAPTGVPRAKAKATSKGKAKASASDGGTMYQAGSLKALHDEFVPAERARLAATGLKGKALTEAVSKAWHSHPHRCALIASLPLQEQKRRKFV